MSQALPAQRPASADASPLFPRRFPFWLPYLLYFLLALGYLFTVPLGESPDEPGHLQCIDQVAVSARLPQIDPPPTGAWWSREAIISGRMCYHMPLYYLLAGGLQWLARGDATPAIMPPSNPEWDGAAAVPMFAHPHKTAWYVLDEAAVITLMRLGGIALGLLTLWATDLVTRRLWPREDATRLAALLLAAGWPQFVFMSRAISNDTLATALGALLLALLLRVGQPRRYVWLGLLACLAILTKITMVFVIGVLLLGFLTESAFLYRARRRDYLWSGVGMGGLLLVLGGLLLWQPTLHEHLRLSELSFTTLRPESLTLTYWWHVFTWTLSSGWARYGWMNLPAPQWQAVLWWGIIAAASLFGWRLAWGASAHVPARRWQVAMAMLWLLGLAAVYARINVNRFQPQFRLILASLPALCALAAVGMTQAVRRWSGWQVALPAFLTLTLFLANGWLIWRVIVPAYR